MRLIKFVFVVQASACLTALAQVSEIWPVETSRPAARTVTVYQGETIQLQPYFLQYGTRQDLSDITGATLYWQTNGMASAWWSKPATVITGESAYINAVFSPTNDFGALKYTYFIRATTSGGSSYRANGSLKMKSSPGYTPATAVSPDYYGDLAVLLAPYVLIELPDYDPLGAALAVSNVLAEAVADKATTGSVAAVAADLQSASNTLAAAAQAISTQRTGKVWSSTTNYMDGSGIFYEIVTTTNVIEGYLITNTWSISGTVPCVEKGNFYEYHSFVTNYFPADGPVPAYTQTNINYYLNGDVDSDRLKWGFDLLFNNPGRWALAPAACGTSYFEYNTFTGPDEEQLTLFGGDGTPPDYQTMLTRSNSIESVVITTNIIDRAVTTNGTQIIIGSTADSEGTVTNLQARSGDANVNLDFFGQEEAEAAITAAIPQFPTNLISGWVLWDYGTNANYSAVILSNGMLSVWEVVDD